LYFTSYFHLLKYMVPFSRYFTVCIIYQPPLIVPSKLLQICFCYTYILYVKELSSWRNKGLRNTISHYSIMLVQLSIAFTENCVYWTYNICGLNHQYPTTTLGFTSFYNNVLNYVHSISPFNESSYNFLISHSHRLVSNYK